MDELFLPCQIPELDSIVFRPFKKVMLLSLLEHFNVIINDGNGHADILVSTMYQVGTRYRITLTQLKKWSTKLKNSRVLANAQRQDNENLYEELNSELTNIRNQNME